MELTLQSFPKINLCLYVGHRQPDGYHSLISLFQKIDNYSDFVTVSYEKADKTEISVKGLENICPAEETTVYKAASVWLANRNENAKISISVIKGIPEKSGMGGGSSDAGSVLLALEKFTGNKLSVSELADLAMKVGSDVPFFVYECDAAVVSGKGEKVLPIESRNDLEFEIFFAPEGKQSTKEAYEQLDRRSFVPMLPTAKDIVYEYRENPRYWAFSNDFEVLYRHPDTKAFLTGSGNAWFSVKIV